MVGKLEAYRRKRDFTATPEPPGKQSTGKDIGAFTVQRHNARRLHYDFRLELDGVLRSWAVPKGPSLDPNERRLAVEVEDHPVEYGEFEGEIPQGHYGAGQVQLWDRGTWSSIDADPVAALKKGHLKFRLHGFKLHGAWTLVRMAKRENEKDDKQNWLLIKEDDAAARHGAEADITDREQGSVKARVANMEKRAPLPEFVEPQLATLVSHAPTGQGWIYEIKYDGYRLLARLDRGRATLYTRNRNDWTARLPTLARQLTGLELDGSWLDGEIVVLDPDGVPDFQALQNAFDRGSETGIQFCIFDAPWLRGDDLTLLPLIERKARLADALAKAGSGDEHLLTYSAHFNAQGGAQDALEQACRLGLEGLIGKRADASYTGRRSGDWIKLKCRQRQEFVIGGYTDPTGSREAFGALLLGLHDGAGKLHYAGRVGTGFDDAQLRALGKRLKAMAVERSPFADPPKEKDSRWVKPVLVAEVAYAGWTRERLLRQASFLGLREDKLADSVQREEAEEPKALAGTGGELQTGQVASHVAGVKLTHPDRFIWPSEDGGASGGITKTDLARYVERVGPWLLPHLAKRPLSLLRCPEGINAECFFQKHLGHQRQRGWPAGVQTFLWEPSSTGHRDYVYVESVEAVIELVQRGIVEFHTWGASLPHPKLPDRITIDLDPAPDLPWQRVVEGAQLARTLLEELGLVCFLKTTGGKGLHIVTPLVPKDDWPQVKTFAKAIATHLAKVLPDRFTANMAKSRRVGRIFVDYLRNDEGATAVAAYSPRARPGAPVSVPLAWEELTPNLRPTEWNLRTVSGRVVALNDIWAGYAAAAREITVPMWQALGMDKSE